MSIPRFVLLVLGIALGGCEVNVNLPTCNDAGDLVCDAGQAERGTQADGIERPSDAQDASSADATPRDDEDGGEPDDIAEPAEPPDSSIEDAAIECDDEDTSDCAFVDRCAIDNGGCAEDRLCIDHGGAAPICECPSGTTDVHGDATECFGVRAVDVGPKTTCAISLAGDLYCWGSNEDGLLGIESADVTTKPVLMSPHGHWTAISVGRSHACGVRRGRLYCWGDSAFTGREENSPDYSHPTEVDDHDDWTLVAAGTVHTCGARDGQLYCWGANDRDQLGTENHNEPTPVLVGTLRGWTELSTGLYHSCGLVRRQAFCWGNRDSFQLGEALDVARGPVVQADASAHWNSISASETGTCGVLDGELYCWGTGSFGDDESRALESPTRIVDTSGWTAVALTPSRLCGIRDGATYCWGSSYGGATKPARVGSEDDWSAVSASADTTCAIRDHRLFCWDFDEAPLEVDFTQP